MPVKTSSSGAHQQQQQQQVELQTLNAQNLQLKTNIYGNLLIPPLGVDQKTRNMEFAVKDNNNNNNGRPNSYQSTQQHAIDGTAVNRNNSGSHPTPLAKTASLMKRYDSGYGYDSMLSVESSASTGALYEEEVDDDDMDQLNDIESINANNQFVISEWQTYTNKIGSPPMSPIYEPNSPPILSSAQQQQQLKRSLNIPTPIPESPPVVVSPGHQQQLQEPENKKRNEFIRKVERFGTDMKDTCLFPLALPMDGSDIFKGKSDWTSISMLADCILIKWLENSRSMAAAADRNRRPVNSSLPDASRYMCPKPELEGRLMSHPQVRLPLRRTNSELDFQRLGFVERRGLVSYRSPYRQQQSTDSYLSAVASSSSTAKARDDIDLNVGTDRDLRRTRSHTSLSVRRRSVQFAAGPPKSGKKDRFDLRVGGNLKTDAKTLVQSIRLESPVSLALQITRIERDLMCSLPADEVMSVVLRKGKSVSDDRSRLTKLLEFGHELSQLIADIIVREVTVEAQGKKIAALIEVGCVLRKLRNWQSLKSLIRGLQLPHIYRLSNAWSVTRNKYPIHFNDYIKLAQVVRKDNCAILRSREPSVPSLTSFIALLRVRCLATWDRLDSHPRWTESPSLVQWLEQQMLSAIAVQQSMDSALGRQVDRLRKKYRKQKQIVAVVEQFYESSTGAATGAVNADNDGHRHQESHMDRCLKELSSDDNRSFIPIDDPIYFIESDHLPASWTQRSARNIPAEYQPRIIRCFKNSYELEIKLIKGYKMS
ncbi:uncharacterized protein LOC128954571 isoform X2 [Oppia nitens]|nr:uncharacterized protein LOC128954571 isoform X2 [Oppia nitens]